MSIAENKLVHTIVNPRRVRWSSTAFQRLAARGFFQSAHVELYRGRINRVIAGAAPPQPWKWTRKQFHRLWELGLIPQQRVQLVDGEIYLMLPQNPPHAAAVKLVEQKLEAMFGPTYYARTQAPLPLGLREDPEPDVAIVKGRPGDHVRQHPRMAVLVVEVADSTLSFDRKKKGPQYARGGISEYWILNLVEGVLEVYREPTRRGYRSCTVLVPSDTASPLALPKAKIRVADLLP